MIRRTFSDCASQALVALLSLNCQVPRQILETFKSVTGIATRVTAMLIKPEVNVWLNFSSCPIIGHNINVTIWQIVTVRQQQNVNKTATNWYWNNRFIIDFV